MRLLSNLIIILILICTVTTSIRCKNYTCGERGILTAFIGFQQSEIDTFVIRRYKANDSFQTLIDSFVITNKELNGGKGYGIYTINNDTTIVLVSGNYPNNGIFPGYDWKIYIPAKNKTDSIFNIISEKNEGSSRCTNPINAFQLDKGIINSPTYFDTQDYNTNGYRAYILP